MILNACITSQRRPEVVRVSSKYSYYVLCLLGIGFTYYEKGFMVIESSKHRLCCAVFIYADSPPSGENLMQFRCIKKIDA